MANDHIVEGVIIISSTINNFKDKKDADKELNESLTKINNYKFTEFKLVSSKKIKINGIDCYME